MITMYALSLNAIIIWFLWQSRKNINLQGKHMIAYPRWALLRGKWNSISNYIGVPGITWGCPVSEGMWSSYGYELCFYIRDSADIRTYAVAPACHASEIDVSLFDS